MAHRVAPQAEGDLDDIWLYVADGNMDVATRLIDAITRRFFFLASFPSALFKHRVQISAPGRVALPWVSTSSSTVWMLRTF